MTTSRTGSCCLPDEILGYISKAIFAGELLLDVGGGAVDDSVFIVSNLKQIMVTAVVVMGAAATDIVASAVMMMNNGVGRLLSTTTTQFSFLLEERQRAISRWKCIKNKQVVDRLLWVRFFWQLTHLWRIASTHLNDTWHLFLLLLVGDFILAVSCSFCVNLSEIFCFFTQKEIMIAACV